MDIVGINYYPNSLTSLPVMGFSVGEYVWAVRRALKGLEYAEKPVWVTETGYPGVEPLDPSEGITLAEDVAYFSEGRQKEYIETTLRSAVENGVNGFFYYSLVTQEDDPDVIPEPMRYSGMVRRDTDFHKPALKAYADLFAKLLNIPNAIDDKSGIITEKAQLHQNYPNPFNPSTVISYQLSVNSSVQLQLYNVQGQLVEILYSGRQEAGVHKIEWNAGRFASGVYYYRLSTDAGFVQTRKLVLIK